MGWNLGVATALLSWIISNGYLGKGELSLKSKPAMPFPDMDGDQEGRELWIPPQSSTKLD